ncbi:MAG TPA: aminopeptidase [Halanaerobiales bacterium]|nr:aminopeptidase [Halanaerobiales bacterium]
MPKEYKAKNAWMEMEEEELNELFRFNREYADFISSNKTEREIVKGSVELLEEAGFQNMDQVSNLKKGDRVYKINRNRALIAAVIGEKTLEEGLRIVGAHLDSPRIDLKPNPLTEESELAYFDTHYYGGIKKYQWVSIPLAIHGIVVKDDGSIVEVNVGEDDDDPVFYISDLLPHLGKDQMQKKMSEGITGEQLNLLIGSMPYREEGDNDSEEKEKVKKAVLNLLNENYGIDGEDLVSAELQIVPAFKARDVGFDRGLLAAYGHDDRVCSFTALKALLDINNPVNTAVALLVDKEEVGSMGNTGMQSRFFENTVAEMVKLYYEDYSDLLVRRIIENSKALSADVNAAFDPNFPDVYAKNNSSQLGKGVVLTKYTGARGKASSSEASAEFVAQVRSIFNNAGVIWQIGELGKVDKGGGGTIAQFLANYNMDVLDCGPAIMAMHAPYEVVSKADVYHTYLGYNVFFEK